MATLASVVTNDGQRGVSCLASGVWDARNGAPSITGPVEAVAIAVRVSRGATHGQGPEQGTTEAAVGTATRRPAEDAPLRPVSRSGLVGARAGRVSFDCRTAAGHRVWGRGRSLVLSGK